jgi:hypothetical protein
VQLQQQQHGNGIGGIHIGGERLFAALPATAAAPLHLHRYHPHHQNGIAAPGYTGMLPPLPLYNPAVPLAPAMFNLPLGFGLGQHLPVFNPAASSKATKARQHRKAQIKASRAARVGGGGAGGGGSSGGAEPAAGKQPSKRK